MFARGLGKTGSGIRTRLFCQALERRDVPATFSVTTIGDSGAGSLRAMLAAANNNPGADTIIFGVTGTITLTTGELAITDDLTISGPGASSLTISGSNSSRVFNNTAPAAFSGITIANGNAATSGAGILVASGALSLSHCIITGNAAGDKGGGIYMAATAGDLTMDGCTISNNTAVSNGGGIDSRSGPRLIAIHNSTIANNTAQARAGLSMIGGTQSLLIENSSIVGNHALVGHGGGIVFASTVGSGGAVVRNSTIAGNSAGQGGGGIQFFASGGLMTVQNCTITENSAAAIGDGFGGGIECGGGGSLDLQSTIVSGNTDGSSMAPDVSSILSVVENYCAIGSKLGFTSTGSNNLAYGLDLKLAPLANNGGPTQTYALLNGSPALDAGSNPATLSTDQRGTGFARIINNAADIGAYELQPISTVWIGGTVGGVNVWENPANWSAGVPGPLDTAVFQTAGTKNFAPVQAVATTITGLSINTNWGGVINSNAALALIGNSSWGSGTISVSGNGIVNSGTMTLNNLNPVVLNGGGKFSNIGTIIDTSAVSFNIGGATTVLDNAVGGLLDLQADAFINYAGAPGTLMNEGILRRSAGTANVSIVCNFTLGGTIDVQTQSLSLSSASAGTLAGATLKVAAGATLDLTGGFTTNVTGAITASGGGTIKHANGTVQLSNDASFGFAAAMYQWTGGALNLNGKTLTNAAGGTIKLNNSATLSLGSGTLLNKGTIIQAGAAGLQVSGASTLLDNAVGGVYDLQSDTLITYAGTPGTFTNEGTLMRSVGSTTATINCNFTLGGTIDVQAATLKLAASGATGTLSSTNIKVASGATVDINGSLTTNVIGALTGSGSGKILHGGGTVQLSGNASFNFPATMYQWISGTLNLNGKTLTNAGVIVLNNGSAVTLIGGSTLVNAGTIVQTGIGALSLNGAGTMLDTVAGGVYDLQANGQVNCVSTTGVFVVEGTLRRSIGTGTAMLASNFNLAGTVDVQSGTLAFFANGVTGIVSGGSLDVAAGATLNLTNGATTNFSGIIGGSGAGKLSLGSGVLSVPSAATIAFADPLFQFTGGTITVIGTLTNAANGYITLSNAGTALLNGGGKLSNLGTIRQTGAGGVSITGASTTLDNAAGGLYDVQSNSQITYVAPAGAFINSGTLRRSVSSGTAGIVCNFTLGGTVDVKTGTFNFAPSGTTGIVNGANLQVAAGATLVPAGFSTIVLAGAITGSGAGTIALNGGNLTVPADASINFPDNLLQWTGGTFTIAPTAKLTNAVSGFLVGSLNSFVTGGGTLANAGTIRLTGNGNLLVSNTGTTLVNTPTGLCDLQGTGAVTFSATKGMFINQGLLLKRFGTGASTVDCNYTNDGGTIEVQSGGLDLPGTVALNKGTLKGPGTLYAPVINTDGTIRRGSLPGKLTIFGDYNQSGTGAYLVQLHGPLPGADYDQIAVSGQVSLGGVLSPTISFLTNPNDSFTIIDNDGKADLVVGTFADFPEGAMVPIANGSAVISYKGGDGNDVTLKIVTPPTVFSAPQISEVKINGGAAQRSMVTNLSVRFDQQVTLPANPAAAFQLIRQSDGATVDLAATVDNTGSGTMVALTFTGGAVNFTSLADGRYTLTALASKISGSFGSLDGDNNGTSGDDYIMVGNPSTNKLFRLFGDSNGSGNVDATDFNGFRTTFGTFNSVFDFDGDGNVNASDFGAFRQRYGVTI